MDPIAHTIFVLVLMIAANFVGKKMGRKEGINAAVAYLIDMGACTEEDLKRANDKFTEGDDF